MTSLYSLNNAFASLLLDAKDRNDLLAQRILSGLFLTPLKKQIHELCKRHHIRKVILAPLRKERILGGGWHSILLLERAIMTLENIKIVKQASDRQTRQASISSQERIRLTKERQAVLSNPEQSMEKSEVHENNVPGILFIDDVLTSGQTAIEYKANAPTEMRKSPWHLLTLFRTPLSVKTAYDEKISE